MLLAPRDPERGAPPSLALLLRAATVPVDPQVPTEDVDRKPVGGTKMDKDILARTMERLRDGLIHKQVVSGREFKGCPFNSKPKLIHFKVSLRGSQVTEGKDRAPVTCLLLEVTGILPSEGQTPAPGGPGLGRKACGFRVTCGDE